MLLYYLHVLILIVIITLITQIQGIELIDIIQSIPNIYEYPLTYIFENLQLKHKANTIWLEFGTHHNRNSSTINYISKFTNDKIYGFYHSSYQEFFENYKDLDENPGRLDDNVELIIGLFHETVLNFLTLHNKKISFIHICSHTEIVNSTKFILDIIRDYIDIDCIIVFDKMVNYIDFDDDTKNLKVFYDFIIKNNFNYEWIGMNGYATTNGFIDGIPREVAAIIHPIAIEGLKSKDISITTTSGYKGNIIFDSKQLYCINQFINYQNEVNHAPLEMLINKTWLSEHVNNLYIEINKHSINYNRFHPMSYSLAEYLISLIIINNFQIYSFLDIGTQDGAIITIITIYLMKFGLKIINTIDQINNLLLIYKNCWLALDLPIYYYIHKQYTSPMILIQLNYYDTIYINTYEQIIYQIPYYMDILRDRCNQISINNINSIEYILQYWLDLKKDSRYVYLNIYEFVYNADNEYIQGIGLIQLKEDNNRITESILERFSWKKYCKDILYQTINKQLYITQNNNNSKLYSVYYAIFAGRSDYLKIHLHYTDILLKLQLITEVHIWDFTLNETIDSDFIANFMKDTSIAGYKLFHNPSINNIRMTNNKTEYLWEVFYEHYSMNKRYKDNDIVIKADDDIVYIDISQFQAFINDIQLNSDHHLHFPIIINNDATFPIQAQRINHTDLTMWLLFYENELKINFTEKINNYYTDNSSVPITTWQSGLYKQPLFFEQIHNIFLTNPYEFIKQLQNYQFQKKIYFNQRISINFFAGKFSVIRKVFRMHIDDYCCNDERFIGLIPTIYHNLNKSINASHIIHSDFVISHFSFSPQYKHFIQYDKYKLYNILSAYNYISSLYEDFSDNVLL